MELKDVQEKTTIEVMGKQVEIDPKRLTFTEVTLLQYQSEEGGWYDYFGSRLAECEAELQYLEHKCDTLYAEKFASFKEEGASDKLAEAKAKSNPDVETARKEAIKAKYKVKLLQQHLRAWDKAHENAKSRGYTIQREIDKLNRVDHGENVPLEEKIDEIIGKGEEV